MPTPGTLREIAKQFVNLREAEDAMRAERDALSTLEGLAVPPREPFTVVLGNSAVTMQRGGSHRDWRYTISKIVPEGDTP